MPRLRRVSSYTPPTTSAAIESTTTTVSTHRMPNAPTPTIFRRRKMNICSELKPGQTGDNASPGPEPLSPGACSQAPFELESRRAHVMVRVIMLREKSCPPNPRHLFWTEIKIGPGLCAGAVRSERSQRILCGTPRDEDGGDRPVQY